MNNFDSFGLPEMLLNNIAQMGFTKPTQIQQQAIPLAMQGRDILGSAQTGTGKTGAFGIPLISKLITDESSSVLVLTPTRELAVQVLSELVKMLGKSSKIKTALLIGGDSMSKQLQQLKNKPRLVVGTPGRINDHLNRKKLNLSRTNFLVMDETDRMLDMGFSIQIETIIEQMPDDRQTMLFSATIPSNIIGIANKYLNKPERISVDAEQLHASKINHQVIQISEEKKYDSFLNELDIREGSVIVFVKTKRGTETMAKKLLQAGHEANAIHGDLKQSRRTKVLNDFRNKKNRILIATDVAARGIDIPHIEHVINYNLPQCAEDYIHRIGRTARGDAEGSALCFVTPDENRKWRAIHRLMYPGEKLENFNDNKPSKSKFKRNNSKGGGGFNKNGPSKGGFNKTKSPWKKFSKAS